MSVPNLKRISLFVQKLLGGPKISKLGHVTLSHAHLGVTLWSGRSRGPSSISLPNLMQKSLFVIKSYKGVPKFRNLVTWPRPRPLRGRFVVRTQHGSVVYVCAKFEADISILSKVIRGSQNFEIWSRDPGHAHFGVVLWSGRSRGPWSMSVPNLKRISLFLQKL